MTAPGRHPLIPPRKVDPHQALPSLEEEVLRRWRERDIFAQSLQIRATAEPWVFYEGPPTANGRPGSHHVLSRVFKDIYPRYKTMRGYRVERKGGWDCHGLPVEIAVERELGISSKTEIEAYGIERFNAKCRESVFAYLDEWNRLTERIGFWIDLDGAYKTLDESYIESTWWAIAEIYRRGLLYEGHKVVPYCPRCGTVLSSHEVAQGYRDVVDPAVYVRLPILAAEDPLQAGDSLLIWTTTPWTLPGNRAVAVAPDVEYARAEYRGETLVLAAALVEEVLGEQAKILDRFDGRELVGRHYGGPIFDTGPRAPFPIIAGAFVTTASGTGLVHIAPAFGEDDFDAWTASEQRDPDQPGALFNPVQPDGTYDDRVRGPVGGEHESRSYAGRFVKDPQLAAELIDDLDRHGLLFRADPYEHSYPHCWRCGTPLIYYAKTSWYIRTTAVRDRLLANNEGVAWQPAHIKHGRFGNWLENNVDWALSRERYWGTPLPLWRCPEGHVHAVRSFAELEQRSGMALADHHRPYVDEITFPCPAKPGHAHPRHERHEVPASGEPGASASDSGEPGASASASGEPGASASACGEPMRRVPEVADVWFDSGAMPFAQHHAPFLREDRLLHEPEELAANAERFALDKQRFPADFVCEALDQTRGWFYSLLAISTLLFDSAPYRNVVCLGLILDGEGQKMSKSKGNAVEPWQVIDSYGADAFRWYFFTSKQPWDGYRFSTEAIGEGVRQFLKQLWSTYSFYVLYAHANRETLLSAAAQPSTGDAVRESHSQADPAVGAANDDLDHWALSLTTATVQIVEERLDAYDATGAGRAIAELVDQLSNWYVRRSRRRFWDGDPRAFQTLRHCLLTIARLLAPFCPFLADEIYDNLDGTLASVHLCDFPDATVLPPRQVELEEAMSIARETVRLGLAARGKAKIKVRQPLREAVVVASGRERDAIERLARVVREELNVRRIRIVADAGDLSRYEIKANYRSLGPLFGKDMPLVAQAIAALDPSQVAATVRSDADAAIGISVAGREHTLTAEDLILTLQPPEGYSVEHEGAHAVALDLAIDEELQREGWAREIVRSIQNARQTAGLRVEDRIALGLSGSTELIEAAGSHRDYLTGETLAISLTLGEGALAKYQEQTEIDGLPLTISLDRAKPEQPSSRAPEPG